MRTIRAPTLTGDRQPGTSRAASGRVATGGISHQAIDRLAAGNICRPRCTSRSPDTSPSKLRDAGVGKGVIRVVYDGIPIPAAPAHARAGTRRGGAREAIRKSPAFLFNLAKNLFDDLSTASVFLYVSEMEGLGSAAIAAMAIGRARGGVRRRRIAGGRGPRTHRPGRARRRLRQTQCGACSMIPQLAAGDGSGGPRESDARIFRGKNGGSDAQRVQ